MSVLPLLVTVLRTLRHCGKGGTGDSAPGVSGRSSHTIPNHVILFEHGDLGPRMSGEAQGCPTACVCMSVSVGACVCARVSVGARMWMGAHVCGCVCGCTCVCMHGSGGAHVCAHVCLWVLVCVHACVYGCTHVCVCVFNSHVKSADSFLPLPKKEGPSTGPVFSVDYGELDFQCREKTPEPPAPCVPEQTEYATIVFPGRPDYASRRASADSPQGPPPLRLEDGHCSWPL